VTEAEATPIAGGPNSFSVTTVPMTPDVLRLVRLKDLFAAIAWSIAAVVGVVFTIAVVIGEPAGADAVVWPLGPVTVGIVLIAAFTWYQSIRELGRKKMAWAQGTLVGWHSFWTGRGYGWHWGLDITMPATKTDVPGKDISMELNLTLLDQITPHASSQR